jgi:protein-S-isoprenylcysteine O-methyltransferase Ste14
MSGTAPGLHQARLKAALLYWLWLPAMVIVSGLLIDWFLSWSFWPLRPLLLVGACLLLTFGVWLVDRATRDFVRYGEGTPAPQAPPKRLVVTGVYAWCRHPMWFGYDLAALGVVLLWRSWGMLLVSFPLFILFQVRFLRQQEERLLLRRFKEEYQHYRDRVPMLLPSPPKK